MTKKMKAIDAERITQCFWTVENIAHPEMAERRNIQGKAEVALGLS